MVNMVASGILQFTSDTGYAFGVYANGAVFERISDNKILTLSTYSLPDSVQVIEWPSYVEWCDGTHVPESEVHILMQIVLDANSVIDGYTLANSRRPVL